MATNYNSIAGAAAIAAIIGASATGLATLYGYSTQGTGPVMRAISADQTALVNGAVATGVNIYVAPTQDDDSLIIGGQEFVAGSTGIDAGLPEDGAVNVNCASGACATPELTAVAFRAAINAQAANSTTAGPPDGGIGYFASKDAGLAANVPITGTLVGAAVGMRGGVDPATRGGPLSGYIANAFNPAVSGLTAPVGSVVRTADGSKAYMKTGTTDTAWVELGYFSQHD
jgi:hypothetical protein